MTSCIYYHHNCVIQTDNQLPFGNSADLNSKPSGLRRSATMFRERVQERPVIDWSLNGHG